MTDSEYMRLALQLAQKGADWVSPNPMVGAVIVKDGVVIGQGYHQEYGGLHAERNALADCTTSPQGATLYVTLSPAATTAKRRPAQRPFWTVASVGWSSVLTTPTPWSPERELICSAPKASR